MEAAGQLLFPLLIIAIFYLLVFRPQQQKMKQHQKMVEALQKGDRVVTQGGIKGKVVRVKGTEENEIEVEIAEGVKVRIVRSTIATVEAKTEPAKA
ncbi:MAG: preprotein translocase subunit YajC [Pseudomonadota bacterium]